MNTRLKNILLNLIALCMGLAAVATLLIATESVLWFQARKAARASYARLRDNQSEFFIPDPELGGKCKAGYAGPHHLWLNGKQIFSVHYEFDEYSRRITPVENEQERSEAALFFGCSFCFGFGVEQDETLPAVFGRQCDTMLPINFANPGHGPQHTWLLIQQANFLDKVPREKGVLLFGFIDDHIARFMGDKELVATWGRRFPWLEVTEDGIEWRGFMEDRESNESLLLKKLQQHHLGRFLTNRLNLVQHRHYTEEEGYQTVARLFVDMKERLVTILPGYELIVFAFPGSLKATQLGAVLKEYEIPFLNYGMLYEHLGNDVSGYFFADSPGTPWGHPKPILYNEVAALLANDLVEYCSAE